MGYAATHGRYCDLTIPSSLASGATHTDFPVCFTAANLPTGANELFDADGTYPAKSDGSDIRFSSDSAGDTPLNVEVERFGIDNNPANGYAEIWVRIPSFSHTVDTVVRCWWNDPDASAVAANDVDEGSQGVWNSSFFGVYHLSESANDDSGNYKDATTNANNLTGSSMAMTPPAGAWSGSVAAEFDGTADYMSKTISEKALPITISSWLYADVVNGVSVCLTDASARNILYQQWESTLSQAYSVTTAGGYDVASKGTFGSGAWYHTAQTYQASSRFSFLNGSPGSENTASNDPVTMDTMIIGVYGDGNSGSLSLAAYWNGKIDEVRFSSAARSAEWIAAEYAVINSIASITAGTPGSPGGVTVVPTFGGRCARRLGSPTFGGRAVRRVA